MSGTNIKMRGFDRYVRLNDALEKVLSRIDELEAEEASFYRARGRVLKEDVVSEVDVPPFDRSAVDGYAVRAANTFGAEEDNPIGLCVVGSVEVGVKPEVKIGKHKTAKIMTGAPMPKGADAVVMVEHVTREGEKLKVLHPLTPWKNVSTRGEDVKVGQTVLRTGQVLRPQDVGMLASIGKLRVRIVQKPGVAIIATGSELREPGKPLGTGQITETNSYSLEASVARCGGVPIRLTAVPDELEPLKGALREASGQDMILVSGGTSVGELDLVPEAISDLGEIIFHGVAIRPGGPTSFGIIGDTPIFGLAGFPVASLVAFDMLVRPALRAMQGLPAERGYPRVQARLSRKVSSSLGRADVVRVQLKKNEKLLAEPIRITGSSILSSMTNADGFIVVPEDFEGFEENRKVEVELYD